MTKTPPARAMRPAPRLRAVVAALATLLVFATGAAGMPGAARAATPAAVATAPPPAPPPVFAMAPGSDGVVGAAFSIAVSVENPSASTIPASSVVVERGAVPLADRAEVAAWLAGESELRATAPVTTGVISSIAARGTVTDQLAVDDTVAGLGALAPGVYALRASYGAPAAGLVARSVMVVPAAAEDGSDNADTPDDSSNPADAAGVAVVVPLTAGALSTDLLSADELAALTAPGGALRAQLDAVTGTPAILAVDPAIVAAIRVLGADAPASAVEWLDDLLLLPNTRVALQFGDADLATQIAAGLKTPLTVSSLGYAVASGSAQPEPTPGATPPATPDTTPAIDSAALLDVGAGTVPVFWPATGTAGADVVARLGDLTVEDVASLTLVASSAIRGVAAPHARAGDAQLLVYDAAVSAALQAASTTDAVVPRANRIAEASAYAAFAAEGRPGEPLFVTVDRADGRSYDALRDTVTAASHLLHRPSTSLAALRAGTPAEVTVNEATHDDARVRALDSFRDDERDLASFASILADSTVLTGPERATILQLLGNAWLTAPDDWRDAVAAHRASTRTTLRSVAIVPPSSITVAGSSVPLAFSIRNDLTWPVSLVLIADPNDARLRVQNSTPVEAGADQVTRVQVPVEARVGSGESTIGLQLRSPSMVAVGGAVTVDVSVRAEWESVGIAVMSTLVGLLIVFGVVRTIRRRRRGTGAGADTGAGTGTGADTGASTGVGTNDGASA